MRDSPPFLVTGATGYVGGRLVGRLLEARHRVCVLVRNPARLQGRAWLVQTAIFAPKGVLGLLYWYALYLFYALLFSGLIWHIARRAEAIAESTV